MSSQFQLRNVEVMVYTMTELALRRGRATARRIESVRKCFPLMQEKPKLISERPCRTSPKQQTFRVIEASDA